MPETSARRSVIAAWRFAMGMLTVVPVRVDRVDRPTAGLGMALAPFVGLIAGLAAGGVLVTARWLSGSPPLAAVLAVGTLAVLTRALHLDGLADLADGLGSGKPAGTALAIMKRSDIGPFGVVTLVITLLLQVAALTQATSSPGGGAAWALATACTAGRLAITWACLRRIPSARPGGLGALVAGTVRRSQAVAVTAVTGGILLGLTTLAPGGPGGPGTLLALTGGLIAAALVRRRAVQRLGGVTGDVLGALVETATTVSLVIWVVVPAGPVTG